MKKHTYTYTERYKALVIFRKPNNDIYNESYLDKIEYLSIDNAFNFNIDLSMFPNVKELVINTKEVYQIPNSISSLKSLKKLITNCILPDNIHSLNELETLTLSGKAILKVPDTITNSSIKTLLILYYEKEYEPIPVPTFIYQMKNLDSLEFCLCKFSHVSNDINNLENLTSLKFECSMTDLKSFPNISNLKKLKELTVDGDSVQGQKRPKYELFKKVLDEIIKLPQLETLDIGCWYPKNKKERMVIDGEKNSIPNIFHKFPELKNLSIHGMKLDFLPDTILKMTSLEKLNIIYNYLTTQEIDNLTKSLPNTNIVGIGFNKSRF